MSTLDVRREHVLCHDGRSGQPLRVVADGAVGDAISDEPNGA